MADPTKTTVYQDSNVITDPKGDIRYSIKTSLSFVKEGDLPHSDIFVHQVVFPNDPKADVFVRIANLHDLGNIPHGRDEAIRDKSALYLYTNFTVEFPDLPTAVAAKKLTQERIDNLVGDYITYLAEFYNPHEINLRLADPGLVAAVKERYYNAHSLKLTKDAAAALATAASLQAALNTARAQADLTAALARTQTCTSNLALLAASINLFNIAGQDAGMTELLAARDKFVDTVQMSGMPELLASIAKYSVAGQDAGMPKLLAAQAGFQAACTAASNDAYQAGVSKTTADAEEAAALSAKNLAAREASDAASAEAVALDAARDICPDFNP